jgi:hypothetical protein
MRWWWRRGKRRRRRRRRRTEQWHQTRNENECGLRG